MKRFLLPLVILFSPFFAVAQDFASGTFNLDELQMKNYDKDTLAHAVILREVGDARIELENIINDDFHRFWLSFSYHVKIKIFDESGYSKSVVEVPLYYQDADHFDVVDNISGVTSFLDESQNVKQVPLEKKNIYTEKKDKHISLVKFALPVIRTGCVIEYSYHIKTPFYYKDFHTWQFQDDVPKIYSEFTSHIPQYFRYKVTPQGTLKFTKIQAENEEDCVVFNITKTPCVKTTYVMADVPAILKENNITASKNPPSALHFSLVQFINPRTGIKLDAITQGNDIERALTRDFSFGAQ